VYKLRAFNNDANTGAIVGLNDGNGRSFLTWEIVTAPVFLTYELVDSANTVLAGSTAGTDMMASSSLDEGSSASATAIFTPTVDTSIKVRVTGLGLAGGARIEVDIGRAFLEVIQLGASATTQFIGASAGTAGTSGFVPAPAAGDQAKALLGNGTWGSVSPTNVPNSPASTLAPVAIANLVAGGNIGTAIATVDINSHYVLTQTTAAQTITLPSPTVATGSRLVVMESSTSSTTTFTFYGATVAVGARVAAAWDGVVWGLVGAAASNDTIQTVATTGATTVTAWGSVVLIPTLTGNITITLPTVVGNTGKKVTYLNVGTPNAFTISLAANGAEVLTTMLGNTELYTSAGALTVEAIDATNARQVSNIGTSSIAEFGGNSFVSASALTASFAAIAATTPAGASQIILPTAGTWEVTGGVDISSGVNSTNTIRLFNVTTGLQVGTAQIVTGDSTAATHQSSGVVTIQITVAAPTTIRIEVLTNSAGNISNGGYLYFKKISGFSPVTGTSVDYLQGSTTSAVSSFVNAGDHVQFNTAQASSGGIVLDTASAYTSALNVASIGRITLQAGKTYKLSGSMGDIAYAAGSLTTYTSYQWFNADNGAAIGVLTVAAADYAGEAATTQYTGMFGQAEAIFTPAVSTRVELRIVGTSGTISSYSGPLANGRALAQIIQLGASATTQFIGASAGTAGTSGFVPAPTAGQQSSVLRGDATWGASATALSGIAAGTAVNTIDSTTFAQTWNWSTATTQNPFTVAGAALTTGALVSMSAPALTATGTVLALAPSAAGKGLTISQGLSGFGTTTPLTTLDVSGSHSVGTASIALAAYTVLAADSIINLILVGAQTLTLPAAASFSRRVLVVTNPTTTVKVISLFTNLSNATSTVMPANGTLELQSDGTVWRLIGSTLGANTNAPIASQRFTGSGTYTPTPGMRSVIVELVGGGGAAGGSQATGIGQYSCGAPGACGGYLKFSATAAQIGASVAITIGAAGVAAVAGASGGGGGNTLFGALATANGGSGGTSTAASAVYNQSGVTAGGSVSLTTGTLIHSLASQNCERAYTLFPQTFGVSTCCPATPLGNGATFGAGNSTHTGQQGVGFGWGSSATMNLASTAASTSVTAGGGLVIVTEFF
jgi:hypothetical protein